MNIWKWWATYKKIENMFTIYMWVCAQSLSRVWLFATPWTVACGLLCLSQARMLECDSISFSRGPSWPRIGPVSPALLAVSCITSRFVTAKSPGKPKWREVGWTTITCPSPSYLWLQDDPWLYAPESVPTIDTGGLRKLFFAIYWLIQL